MTSKRLGFAPRQHRLSMGLAALSLGFLNALPGASHARCLNPDEVMGVVTAYINKQPMAAFTVLNSMAEAYCSQGMVAAEIGRSMGTVAGYKAAFTSNRVREQYRTQDSQRAYLYEKMFLKNGVAVASNFGARPSVSADLLFVMKDYGILEARTPLEALSHVSHVVPYIELSDLMLDGAQEITPMHLVATNLGTRLGVMGTPIAVQPTQAFLDALANMRIVMRDANGQEMDHAMGHEMLGNPIAALQWLARDLEQNAQRIQMNDRISVGAFFPAHSPKAGSNVTVQYEGLPGDPSVGVSFR